MLPVRSKSGYPVLSDFSRDMGTPVVIDTSSGRAYVLKDGDIIVDLTNNLYYAKNFGASFNGTADDTSALQTALNEIGSAGGGVLMCPPGTAMVSGLQIPDYTWIVGAARTATVLKLISNSNADLITRHASFTGLRAGLKSLTLNGNEAGNVQGGVFWDGPNNTRGPTITIEDVTITACRHVAGGGAPNAAVLTQGNSWGMIRDCDITSNSYPVGLWHKGSDWKFHEIYFGPNGSSGPNQNVILQAGSGNEFGSCYFGGNGGYEQVLLWGAQRNDFNNCFNDNAWQHGYRLIDFAGVASSDNNFVGGRCTSPGQSANNTYDAFAFEGAATGNQIIGCRVKNLTATLGRYAFSEAGTAGANLFVGLIAGASWGTAADGLRVGGGSRVDGCLGIADGVR